MSTATGKIVSKKRLNDEQETNYQVNMNKVLNDLILLVERSQPIQAITMTHQGITITFKVDFDKATKK